MTTTPARFLTSVLTVSGVLGGTAGCSEFCYSGTIVVEVCDKRTPGTYRRAGGEPIPVRFDGVGELEQGKLFTLMPPVEDRSGLPWVGFHLKTRPASFPATLVLPSPDASVSISVMNVPQADPISGRIEIKRWDGKNLSLAVKMELSPLLGEKDPISLDAEIDVRNCHGEKACAP
jgi:hypothetical protein